MGARIASFISVPSAWKWLLEVWWTVEPDLYIRKKAGDSRPVDSSFDSRVGKQSDSPNEMKGQNARRDDFFLLDAYFEWQYHS